MLTSLNRELDAGAGGAGAGGAAALYAGGGAEAGVDLAPVCQGFAPAWPPVCHGFAPGTETGLAAAACHGLAAGAGGE